jgi:hypothetical protein
MAYYARQVFTESLFGNDPPAETRVESPGVFVEVLGNGQASTKNYQITLSVLGTTIPEPTIKSNLVFVETLGLSIVNPIAYNVNTYIETLGFGSIYGVAYSANISVEILGLPQTIKKREDYQSVQLFIESLGLPAPDIEEDGITYNVWIN